MRQGFKLTIGIAHRQTVNRQTLAFTAQGEVRLGPLPAVKYVYRRTGDTAHLVGLFRQPLQAQHFHAGRGQPAFHPTCVFSAHH
ncbi:hypothetical protein D3C81_1825370 [compost metagenome]